MPDPLPLLLTVKEAAELLRTTPKGIYTMAERKKLPGAVRVGSRLLVRSRDLLRSLGVTPVTSPAE